MKNILIYSLLIYSLIACNKPESLPNLGQIKDFSFSAADGVAVNNSSMSDKIWLINFFFTSCPSICPTMMKQISKVLDKSKALNAVSISIDPTDTLERLAEYEKKYKVNPNRWHLVKGDITAIKRFAIDQLKLGFEDDVNLHTKRIVMVDQKGFIRGYFDSADENVVEQINSAVSVLQSN